MRKPLTFAFWQIVILTTLAYVFLVFGNDPIPYPPLDKPDAVGSPVEMMDRFDCWTDDVPADMVGVIPNHVIIRYHGTDKVIYGGPKAVHIAFEQVLNDAPTEHQIFGFCR